MSPTVLLFVRLSIHADQTWSLVVPGGGPAIRWDGLPDHDEAGPAAQFICEEHARLFADAHGLEVL